MKLQGQEPDGDERSLGEYCATGQGIDIIILSFLDSFGDGTYPNGYLGDCSINSDGSSDGCESLETDIGTCQSNGVKVFMSIGGGGAPWQLSGTGDAQGVAYSLWNSYANPDVTSDSARPLGDVSIDGWDLDIESDPNGASAYLQDLVDALRGYFSSDSSKSYYISGAPQCPLPIADMDAVIKNSQFDYLFIQFYNNNCAAAELTDPSGNNPDGNGLSFPPLPFLKHELTCTQDNTTSTPGPAICPAQHLPTRNFSSVSPRPPPRRILRSSSSSRRISLNSSRTPKA